MTNDPQVELDYVRGRVMALESFCNVFFISLHPEPILRDQAKKRFKRSIETMQEQKLSPSFRRGMEDAVTALMGEMEDTDPSPFRP